MESNSFVAHKLSLLEGRVDFTPEQLDAAWIRIQAPRRRAASPYWKLAAAAAVLLIGGLLTPPGRAIAQSLWTSVVLQRTQPIALDLSTTSMKLLMPNVFPMAPSGEMWRPATLRDAEEMTGFHIATMASPHLPYAPTFRVELPRTIERKIDLAEIRQELARLGRPPVDAPEGIDGANVVLRPQGRFVVTSYGSCPQIVGPWRACAFLVQSRPRILDLPPNIGWPAFARFSLELAGLTAQQGDNLLATAQLGPALFLPSESPFRFEAVNVHQQPAALIRYADGVAFVLQWQDGGFHYNLFGRNPAAAVAMAETLR